MARRSLRRSPVVRLGASAAVAASLLLAGPASHAREKNDVQRLREELKRILETYDPADVATAFAGFGIELPGTRGFRGMRYSEFHLEQGCWRQGPETGIPKNDDCIVYQSKCSLSGGASSVKVFKLGGDTESRSYDEGRRIYACKGFIHLPPDEPPVFDPTVPR